MARQRATIAASAGERGAERARSTGAGTAKARRRPQFHPLGVARIERLTDDAVAVTFDVPPELAEEYHFAPGQALTLRRVEGDRD